MVKHDLQRPDPRNLVGMSAGAKKRVARRFAERWSGLPWSDPRLPTSGTWEATKMFFRIGERLRPCLGCSGCNAGMRDALYGQRSEYDAPIIEDGPCGGSFVVDKQKAGSASAVRRERRWL